MIGEIVADEVPSRLRIEVIASETPRSPDVNVEGAAMIRMRVSGIVDLHDTKRLEIRLHGSRYQLAPSLMW